MAKSVSKLAEVAKEGIGESAFTNMHLQMCIYNCAFTNVQLGLQLCRTSSPCVVVGSAVEGLVNVNDNGLKALADPKT